MQILCESPYGLKSDENTDKDYFLKKFSWTIEKLEEYIKRPGIKHHIYGGENYKWDLKRKVALAFKFLFKN